MTALAEVAPARELGIGHDPRHGAAASRASRPLQGAHVERREPGASSSSDGCRQARSSRPSPRRSVRSPRTRTGWPLPGRRVALVGAGAEIGPLAAPQLAGVREVLALDLPQPRIWDRIAAVARSRRRHRALPIAADGPQGVDLLVDLPEALAWLRRAAGDSELALGMYAYAGRRSARAPERRFRRSRHQMLVRRRRSRARLPRDAHGLVRGSAKTRLARRERPTPRAGAAGLQAPAQLLSGGRFYRPAYADGAPVADALVTQQGPNYALAKRLPALAGSRGGVRRPAGVVQRRPGHPHPLGHEEPHPRCRILRRASLRHRDLRPRDDPHADGGAARSRPQHADS